MSKQFSLTNSTPEPLTVTDANGQEHTAKLPAEFGLTDFARLMELRGMISDMAGTNIQTLTVEKAEAVENVMDEFVTMILPTLSAEARAKINFGTKQQLINWWLAESTATQTEGAKNA